MSETLKRHYYDGLHDDRIYIVCHTYIYQVSQDIASNKTRAHIVVTLNCGNGASYYLNDAGSLSVKVANTTRASVTGESLNFNFNNYSVKTLLDTTIDLDHNTDGTFNEIFETKLTYGTYGTSDISGSVTFDTISRPSEIGTISDFNLEDTFSVPVDKKSTSFTDDLVIKQGSTVIKTVLNYTGGANINLTDSELFTAYNVIDKSAVFTFETTTKIGSTTVGTDSATATGTAAGTAYIKIEDSWRRAIPYIRVNGVWKKAIANVKSGGSWKRGIG